MEDRKKEPNQSFRDETSNAWHENMLDGTKADKTLQKGLVNLKTQQWKLSKREIPRGKNDRKHQWYDVPEGGGGFRKNIGRINGRKMSRLGETYKPTGLSSTRPVCRKPYVEETVPRHIIQFVKTWRNVKKTVARHIIELLKTSKRGDKSIQRKKHLKYRGAMIRTSIFLVGKKQAKRQWSNIFKVLKGIPCQPRSSENIDSVRYTKGANSSPAGLY